MKGKGYWVKRQGQSPLPFSPEENRERGRTNNSGSSAKGQ